MLDVGNTYTCWQAATKYEVLRRPIRDIRYKDNR